MIPFAITAAENYNPIVMLGFENREILGLEYPSSDLWTIEPEDITGLVNTSPAAVFWGIRSAWTELVRLPKVAANRGKKRLRTFSPKGQDFPLLPPGVLSGFPVASRTIRKLREEIPSLDTILVSAIFAVSTVRTRIEEAEVAYRCFGELYKARSRTMPPVSELRACFRGLQNSKSAMFSDVAAYTPTIRQGMELGYRDRELRSLLALDTSLPKGLGLAKLSFTLALLGHDCICLDARLLNVIFPKKKDRDWFLGQIGKEGGRVSERALLTYESAEDTFLSGNPHYDRSDPLGRARAQWQSWESVGRKGATHQVWMDLLPEGEL